MIFDVSSSSVRGGMDRTISVVIPVFNGAESLDELFARFGAVEEELRRRDLALAYIMVDDGSSDRTFLELLKWKQRKPALAILKLSRNFGAVAASNAGLRHVRGDAFTIYACDLQDPPELIVRMADLWLSGQKFVICQREQRRADPFVSRFFARIYYRLVRWLVLERFPETGFDIFLLDADYLHYLQNAGKNINRSLYTYWLGIVPEVLTYARPKRHAGRSGWTLGRKLKLVVDTLLGFGTKPLRLFILLGLGVASLSFAYGTAVVVGALLGNITVPGYASLVVSMSFMFGLVFLLLGLIAEYLWRVFEEVNKRPEAVVETFIE